MSMILRLCALCLALAMLAGCSVPGKGGASAEEIQRAAYVHKGPPRLTLFTMISTRSGQGAHTSLMINGSQRVVFDPAGTFRKEGIISRDDVIFGMTPYMADVYTRFHARETFYVVLQEIDVSPEVAELALQKAISHGAVPEAQCALSTSQLISTLPGFEDIKPSFFPRKLMEQFEAKGARSRTLHEYDDDDKTKVLADFDPNSVPKDVN